MYELVTITCLVVQASAHHSSRTRRMRLVREAEVRVAPNKHGFLALLLEAAERVPGCRTPTPRGRILCVAAQVHVDGATLFRALERTGLPDWSTLDKLEAGTEIPLLRWLVAL